MDSRSAPDGGRFAPGDNTSHQPDEGSEADAPLVAATDDDRRGEAGGAPPWEADQQAHRPPSLPPEQPAPWRAGVSDDDAPWDRPEPFRLEDLTADEGDPDDAFAPLADDLAAHATDESETGDVASAAQPRDPVSWPPIPTDLFRQPPPPPRRAQPGPPQLQPVSAVAVAAPPAPWDRRAAPPSAPWDDPAPWDQPRRHFAPPDKPDADVEPEVPEAAAPKREFAPARAITDDAEVPWLAIDREQAPADAEAEAAEDALSPEASPLQTTLVTVLVALGVVALVVTFLSLFPALFG